MAEQYSTNAHAQVIADYANSGWMTRGFSSFIFNLHFLRRLLSCTKPSATPRMRAQLLWDSMQNKTQLGKVKMCAPISKIVTDAGRPMNSRQVLARIRAAEKSEHAKLRRVPDAWRLAPGAGEEVVIEVTEVSCTYPLFKDRLYDYSYFDDNLWDCGPYRIRLFEHNAISGAIAEHDLPAIFVDACRYRAAQA